MLIAGPALAQTLGLSTDAGVSYWRVAAALVLCLLLAGAGALVLRARMRGGAHAPLRWRNVLGQTLGLAAPSSVSKLRLVETLRVNPQLEICLLVSEGSRYLIASSAQGVVLLDKSPASDAEAAPR